MTTDSVPTPAIAGARSASDAAPVVEDLSFDDAFGQLRAAVAELEAGGLSLEETIARTERAVALQRHCERLLTAAELRVQQLISRPGGGLLVREISAEEATDSPEG